MLTHLLSHRFSIPALSALGKLFLHLGTNIFAGYGYFRDELYYIVSTEHLAAGFVDHPPLSIWILELSNALFGESLFAVRLLPAVAGAATMFICGLMVIELGGNRFAQVLACLAFLVSPIFLAMNTFYSMNALDILLSSLALLLFLRIIRAASDEHSYGPTNRQWALLGVLLGLGLLNKVGVLWLGFGIASSLIFTPLRRYLSVPGPWVALGIAIFCFLPYVVWNASNDWAHLEFIRNASTNKYSGLRVSDFVVGQFVIHNPVTAPLWVAGLLFFLTSPLRDWRAPGILFLGAFLVLVLNGTSKPEYLAPVFPMLFAAGGIRFQMMASGFGRVLSRRIYPVGIALGILLAPLTLPVLPVETYIGFAQSLGVTPTTAESKQLAELPQFYADMFGWPELAERVSEVYHMLNDSDRSSCAIYGQNYGEASAVTFFGKRFGLPRAISGHNSFFLWGPGPVELKVVIIIGGREEDHRRVFDEVVPSGTHRTRYAMPYENNLTIYICRGLRVPLHEAWARSKNYS